MGENEQGGMLRTVVVVGIIAMVALIITLGVVGLKSNMTKNTKDAIPPDQIFTPGDGYSVSHSYFDEASTMKIVNGALYIDTPASSTPKWARYDSAPSLAVPKDKSTVKFTVVAKAMPGSMYVHPWLIFYDANGNQMDGSYYLDIPTDGVEHTYSKEGTIPNHAKTYTISFQTREASHVVYKSGSVTFYK